VTGAWNLAWSGMDLVATVGALMIGVLLIVWVIWKG
jgi:hypothetical protein